MRAITLAVMAMGYAAGVRGSSTLGCYSSVKVAQNKGSIQFQTSDTCTKLCLEYAYVALKNGGECYCLSSMPTDETDGDSCSTVCNGYGDETCGGPNAYNVFKGSGSKSDDLSSSSLSSSSTSSSSSSSSSSKTSSSTSSSSSASPTSTSDNESTTTPQSSSPSTTLASETKDTTSSTALLTTVVTSKSSDGSNVVYITRTQSQSQSPTSSTAKSTASGSSKDNSNSKKESKSNVGPIVGGVVGGVGGAILLAVLAFLFIRHRNSTDESEDEEEFYDKPSGLSSSDSSRSKKNKALSPLDMPMSNPFTDPSEATVAAGGGNNSGLVDPRLNPIMMGRRRLSDGSLADETDYSRKVLQVANPDD